MGVIRRESGLLLDEAEGMIASGGSHDRFSRMSTSGPQSPDQPPTRRSLRRRIEPSLPTRAVLDAFCMDYFPETHRPLSPQLSSTEIISQLFLQHSEADIERALMNATAPAARYPANEVSEGNSIQPINANSERYSFFGLLSSIFRSNSSRTTSLVLNNKIQTIHLSDSPRTRDRTDSTCSG